MVGMAVVAARKLDDRIAPSGAARQTHSGHDRLGARRHEPNHLQVRDSRRHELGQLHFLPAGRAEGKTRGGGRRHRLHHVGVGVPQDQRPPGADVVDETTAVRIKDVAADAVIVK